MMKLNTFTAAGVAGILASLLSYFGHDGADSAPSLISMLLGGGGLSSLILGFVPDKNPDGGGADKPDGGSLSLANFTKAMAMYKAAKAVGSPGDAKLTKEEVMGILKLFMPEVVADVAVDDDAPISAAGGGRSIQDAMKYAQFFGQLMQLKPVLDAFKTKGGAPAYTEMLLIWDAETIIPVKLGVDPRVQPAPTPVPVATKAA